MAELTMTTDSVRERVAKLLGTFATALQSRDTLRCISIWTDDILSALALALPEQSPDDWTPTAENVNALPEPLRQYVHDLQTRCDPTGDIRELTIARDTIRSLEQSPDGWQKRWERLRACRLSLAGSLEPYTELKTLMNDIESEIPVASGGPRDGVTLDAYVAMQRHRDRWRGYALEKPYAERPKDYLDPGDDGSERASDKPAVSGGAEDIGRVSLSDTHKVIHTSDPIPVGAIADPHPPMEPMSADLESRLRSDASRRKRGEPVPEGPSIAAGDRWRVEEPYFSCADCRPDEGFMCDFHWGDYIIPIEPGTLLLVEPTQRPEPVAFIVERVHELQDDVSHSLEWTADPTEKSEPLYLQPPVEQPAEELLGASEWEPTRNFTREQVLEALADAAWNSRMDGGCHSRTSEILTLWHKHLSSTAHPPVQLAEELSDVLHSIIGECCKPRSGIVDLKVDGQPYIDESTTREIAFAESLGMPVTYWSKDASVRLVTLPSPRELAQPASEALQQRLGEHARRVRDYADGDETYFKFTIGEIRELFRALAATPQGEKDG